MARVMQNGESPLMDSVMGHSVWQSQHAFHLPALLGKFVQKSVPAQIRQLVLHVRNDKGQAGGFVGELTLARRKYSFCQINSDWQSWHGFHLSAMGPAIRAHSCVVQDPLLLLIYHVRA